MVKTGQFRGAIEQTNKALEIDSTNIKALFRKGLAFASLDEWANAEENFNKVLELEPDNKDAKLEIAKMKRRKVDTEKQAKKKPSVACSISLPRNLRRKRKSLVSLRKMRKKPKRKTKQTDLKIAERLAMIYCFPHEVL